MLGIIVYPIADWDGFHRRPMLEALARTLAGKATLIVIEPPLPLRFPPKAQDWGRHARALLKPMVLWSENVWLARTVKTSSDEKTIYAAAIRRALKQIRPSVDGLSAMFFRPHHIDLLGLANEQHVIYECYDEYRENHGGRADDGVIEKDRRLTAASDLVLTTSQRLYDSRSMEHDNVHLAPNGVKFELFQQAWDPGLEIPQEMADIDGPVVGYVGNFATWLDFPLLHHVIGALPSFNFVFVGPVTAVDEADRLKQFDNVRFLGPKPQHALPAYMRAMDVVTCLLRISEYTHNALPLTVIEYLAAGRPIATRELKGMAAFQDVLYTPSQPDDVVECIRQLSTEPDEGMRERGRERAEEFDWGLLTEKTADLILSTCSERSERREGH